MITLSTAQENVKKIKKLMDDEVCAILNDNNGIGTAESVAALTHQEEPQSVRTDRFSNLTLGSIMGKTSSYPENGQNDVFSENSPFAKALRLDDG